MRWNLIQQGTERKSIKIQGTRMYASKKLVGQISNLHFEYSSSLSFEPQGSDVNPVHTNDPAHTNNLPTQTIPFTLTIRSTPLPLSMTAIQNDYLSLCKSVFSTSEVLWTSSLIFNLLFIRTHLKSIENWNMVIWFCVWSWDYYLQI